MPCRWDWAISSSIPTTRCIPTGTTTGRSGLFRCIEGKGRGCFQPVIGSAIVLVIRDHNVKVDDGVPSLECDALWLG